jgi:hypothetical protein
MNRHLSAVHVLKHFSSYQVNEFKMWLGASETAFGALIGIVFERLFGVQPAGTGVQPAGPSGTTQHDASGSGTGVASTG